MGACASKKKTSPEGEEAAAAPAEEVAPAAAGPKKKKAMPKRTNSTRDVEEEAARQEADAAVEDWAPVGISLGRILLRGRPDMTDDRVVLGCGLDLRPQRPPFGGGRPPPPRRGWSYFCFSWAQNNKFYS